MGETTFDQTALRITPSPPPSLGSASSAVESKYLGRVRNLNYGRIALSAILVALGLAVVGTEAHALQTYNHTHLDSEWWLPLWPQYFDLRDTVAILVGGVVVTFTSLVYLVVAVLPSPRSRTMLLNILFASVTFLNILTLLITTGYSLYVHRQDKRLDRTNIRSWTCRWAGGVSGESVATSAGASESSATMFGENGGIESPAGFGRLCRETKAAWGITIAMVCLDGVVGLAAALWGWWLTFRVWRERRKEGKKWEKQEWVMQNGNGVGGRADA